MLQSRVKAGPLAEKRRVQKFVQGIASIGFVAVYIISGFDHHYRWSDVPSWLSVFSDVFVILAMLLFFIVFRKNSYLSATIETQEAQHVISDGPYGMVRHPMYWLRFYFLRLLLCR